YCEFLPIDQSAPPSALPQRFDSEENTWKKILADHGFKNIEQSLRLLKEFTQGPGYVHVSKRTVELAWQLIPKILHLCASSPSPLNGETPELRGEPTRLSAVSAPAKGEAAITASNKRLSDPDRVLARLDSFLTAYGARSVMFETW